MRARILIALLATEARGFADDKPSVTIGGYVETYYQVSFQNPSNRITNLRGYDNRSRTFTLSNVAIEATGESGPLTGHVVLQWGHTPSSYYLDEPVSQGTSSVDTSTGELWKYVQSATVAAKAPHEITITAGLMLTPIGVESVQVKSDWNWSRSNLAFALPNYMTGVMVARPLSCGWTGKLGVLNGWNSVVDDNGYPSMMALAAYSGGPTTAQLLYFGGIERPSGAPEGQPWRSLFDAIVQTSESASVSIAAQGDAGFESGDLGTSWWIAGAGYLKWQLSPEIYAAARGDIFYAKPGQKNGVSASPLFWPVRWVAEGTATLAYQPFARMSVRLEYRHDQGAGDAYFGGTVRADPTTGAFIANREGQDTLTVGVTGWF